MDWTKAGGDGSKFVPGGWHGGIPAHDTKR